MQSEEVQRSFIQDYEYLYSEAKYWNIHIMFYDPVHQLHNSSSGRCWIEKWTEYFLKSNTWRKRVTAMWAINPLNMQFSWIITEDNCDSEMTKATLKVIRNDYPDEKPIHIILDNAAYNRSYEVQDYAESLGIVLYFLPPYSPNLNLIERLRKFMKKILVKNRYFETFQEFYDAFIDFFVYLKKHHNKLITIFNNKFQILKEV